MSPSPFSSAGMAKPWTGKPQRVKFIEDEHGIQKWCKDCKTYKYLVDFHARRSGEGVADRCTDCSRNRQYYRRYGITLDQYREMHRLQNGKCAICGLPPKARDLAVDHDHETGKVRALLCAPCNVGLVHVERPGWVEKAKAYLEEHSD